MNFKSKFIFPISISIISGLVVAGFVFAWTNPTANPPSGGGALYYSSGRVGIGTASPGEILDVIGNTRLTGYFSLVASLAEYNTTLTNSLIYNTAGSGTVYPFLDYGNLVIQSRASGAARDIVFVTGNTTPLARMVILRTGDIGIGTTGPGASLEVLKNVPNGTIQVNQQISGGNGNFTIAGTGVLTTYLGLNDTQTLGSVGGYGNGSQFGLGLWGAANSGAPNVFVMSGGNVGIGKTAPGYKLDVVGDINFTGTLRQNGTPFASGGIQGGGTINYVSKFTGSGTIGNSQIFDNGTNVGIGTASPAEKLTIQQGKVLVTEADDGASKAIVLNGTNYGGVVDLYYSNNLNTRVSGDANVPTYFNAGNSVGIGTAAPAYKLDVSGQINAYNPSGTGISGSSNANYGVFGSSNTSVGVYGGSQSSYGILGSSNTSIGVYGGSNSNVGVYGFSGSNYGVYGSSNGNIAIYGYSNNNAGVQGNSTNNMGIVGNSVNSFGVSGYSTNAYGVYGFSGNSSSYDFYGAGPKSYFAGPVYANGGLCLSGTCNTSWPSSQSYWGAYSPTFGYSYVYPTNTTWDASVAIGMGNPPWGVWPSYKLYVNGSFAATSKNFDIQDPRYNDPKKRLVHGTLEGPESAVFYRGEEQLVNGKAVVVLPDYFEALTRKENRTVLLTPKFDSDTEPISQLAASSVNDGKFTVRGVDNMNPSQKFFWEVKAVRSDIVPLQAEKISP